MLPTAARGELAPSTVRKTGSLPMLRVNRACRSFGVVDQPAFSLWQLAQLRPLPMGLKKGLAVSMPPAVLKVSAAPLAFSFGCGATVAAVTGLAPIQAESRAEGK